MGKRVRTRNECGAQFSDSVHGAAVRQQLEGGHFMS
jgi:hypothetical protein